MPEFAQADVGELLDAAVAMARCVARPLNAPVEDFESAAALALGRACVEWDGRGRLAGYALQRVRWALLDQARANERRVAPGLETEPEARLEPPVDREALADRLAVLTDVERRIVELTLAAGLSIDEAAERLGCSPANAYAARRRAARRLGVPRWWGWQGGGDPDRPRVGRDRYGA